MKYVNPFYPKLLSGSEVFRYNSYEQDDLGAIREQDAFSIGSGEGRCFQVVRYFVITHTNKMHFRSDQGKNSDLISWFF